MTADIPDAFMQGDQDETVHMKLEGTLAELLARCDPTEYQPYLVTEHGKTVLYVELVKALYGTIRAALIFGINSPNKSPNGGSPLAHMIGVWPIKWSVGAN